MRCPRCGRENDKDALRCSGCGYEFTGEHDETDRNGMPRRDFNEYRPREIPPESRKPIQPSKPGRLLSAFAHALFYVMLFVGCQSVVVSGYLTSLMSGDPTLLTDPDAMSGLFEAVNEKTVLILLISNLLTVLLVCMLMHIRKREPAPEMEIYPVNPFRFGTFALFGAAMNIVVSVTMSLLPLPESMIAEHAAQTMVLYGEMNPLLELFSVAVVAGITEELIFRGLVISRLKKGMGTAAAVVISAVIFGVVHGSALAVIYASLLGLLLGGLYARYDSVLPGMIFHVFFNMTSYWLPQEGTVLTVLYIVSAAAVLLCAWRIFLCYPAFSDIYTDVRDRLKPANEEEAAIIAEVKQHQRRGMITAEELEKLHDRWVENRKQIKKSKKYGRRK